MREQEASESATLWALDVLDSKTAIILDTETTGLTAGSYVIELAVIDTSGKTLLNSLIALPDEPHASYRRWINPGAMEVHAISIDTLQKARTWPDVREEFLEIASQASHIISYNAEFDYSKLMATDEAWGIDRKEDWEDGAFDWSKWTCAMIMYTQFVQAQRWVALGGRHRALGDCLTCLKAIREMAEGSEWISGSESTSLLIRD